MWIWLSRCIADCAVFDIDNYEESCSSMDKLIPIFLITALNEINKSHSVENPRLKNTVNFHHQHPNSRLKTQKSRRCCTT